jgi:uncharacterized protein
MQTIHAEEKLMAKDRPPLEEMTLRQLRRVAQEYEISRYSRMRKSQLFEAIMMAKAQKSAALSHAHTSHRNTDIQEIIEAKKFDLGSEEPMSVLLTQVDEVLGDLPAGYGENRIVLMPRDPQWAYAYWDVSNSEKEKKRQQGGQKLALRLYDSTGINMGRQVPHSMQEYGCDELAREYYLQIPVSDRDYIVEIGYRCADGRWLPLVRSASVRIPPMYPSDWVEDHFITVSWEQGLKGQNMFALVAPSQLDAINESDLAENSTAESPHIAGSLYGEASGSGMMQDSASSYIFPSGTGAWASGSGMSGSGMSGVGMSGVGMSGIGVGMSGVGMSGVGMSGIGVGMSGVGMSGIGVGMSGVGMSGVGMSGIGVGMSGVGMSGVGMSGIGVGMSGVGMSGVGMSGISVGMSGVGMSGIGMSGVGVGMSGVGMSGVGMSGVGMSGVGMSGIGVGMSGVGMSGVGMSGIGMSGVGMSGIGVGMSGVGMSGVGMSGIGMSGIGVGMSGVGMSGIGVGMSGVGMSGVGMSGVGMSGIGIGMSGVGMSGIGIGMSGVGMSGIGMSGVGMSGIGIGMSGVGMSGIGMSGVGMSGIGIGMSGVGMSGVGIYGLGMSGIGMSGIGMSGVGMSGIGMSGIGIPRQFWLVADAELIVYGATEPDANVTIAGRPISLNPDGTFRFHMSFQDGLIDFPIFAVAADGEQNRSIHMKFERQTPERRTNAKEAAIPEWIR